MQNQTLPGLQERLDKNYFNDKFGVVSKWQQEYGEIR